MGDLTPVARSGAPPEAGDHGLRAGGEGERGKRYRSGAEDAGSQTDVVCRLSAEEERMKEDGCGNDGPWTPRKTKGRFPSAPTALGNRQHRDSHIPTAATRRGKVENESHVSHFPACCFIVSKKNQKGGPAAVASLPPPGSFFD